MKIPISDIVIGERRRKRKPIESDLHQSIKRVLAAELIMRGMTVKLEYRPLQGKKFRLDIAIPAAKVGIEIYMDAYSVSRRNLINRTKQLQNEGWFIEWFIPFLHLRQRDLFVQRIASISQMRSGVV